MIHSGYWKTQVEKIVLEKMKRLGFDWMQPRSDYQGCSDLDSVILSKMVLRRDYYVAWRRRRGISTTVREFDVAFDAGEVPFLLGLFITLFLMVMAT